MKHTLRSLLVLFIAAALAPAGTSPRGVGDAARRVSADSSVTLGLIAYYPFTGNASDASGHGNNGTVFGALLAQDIHNDSASAYSFDGVDDHILLPDSLIQKHASLSVSLWFRTVDGGAMFGYQSVPYPAFPPPQYVPALYVGVNGSPYAEYWNGDDTPLTSPMTVNDNQWHFMALTGDAATQTLIVDGAVIGSLSGPIDHLAMIKNQIGMGNTGVNNLLGWVGGNDHWFGFKGSIDNVRIYDRALDTAECSMLYRYESGAPPPPGVSLRFIVANGVHSDTLRFGTDTAATFCLDAGLGELALPPAPPSGVFDARFVHPRPDESPGCFANGTHRDYRPVVSPAQADTYRVQFQPSTLGYPIMFSWSAPSTLYPGDVTLVDPFGGILVHVNMKTQNTYTLTNPLLHELVIIAGGPADTGAVPDTASYRTFTQADYAQRAYRLRSGRIPTGANVRDETFMQEGWFTNGLTIGIPRPDSTLQYGWVYFRRNTARLSRFLPHTGPPRGFDFYIGGKPWHYSRANPAVAYHNNHLAGEQYTLKFNVGASDAGITPAGFGELVFVDLLDPANPFNAKTVRQLMEHADSVLTFFRRYPTDHFVALDACLSRINSAFLGPVTGHTVAPLRVDGAQTLSSVPFLHRSSDARPRVRPGAGESMEPDVPTSYALYQNYPNPFNPATVIEFDLPAGATVSLTVYNLLGQDVASVLNGASLEEGRHSVEFDGSGLPSGVYFYRLTLASGDREASPKGILQTRKMVLLQ